MFSRAMILTREITAAVELRRRRLHFVQHAVDAVAHLQPVLERLDVDVRGALLHRALRIRLTSRITGASEARSRRCSTSSSPDAAPSPSRFSTMVPIAERPVP